jgi:hypothetical protein
VDQRKEHVQPQRGQPTAGVEQLQAAATGVGEHSRARSVVRAVDDDAVAVEDLQRCVGV